MTFSDMYKRRGIIRVSLEALMDSKVRTTLAQDFIILDAYIDCKTWTIKYTGCSSKFAELPEGANAPTYNIEVLQHETIS